MAAKREKAKGKGLLGAIQRKSNAAGEGLANYLLKGLFLKGKKRKTGAKSVKAK